MDSDHNMTSINEKLLPCPIIKKLAKKNKKGTAGAKVGGVKLNIVAA